MKTLRYPVLALALAACGPKTETPAAPPAESAPPAEAAQAFEPSDSQEALYRLLSLRDDVVDCKALAEASETVVADLAVIADQAKMPPWAGVRAAHCLSSHYAEASQEHLVRWLGSAETAGLARAILDNVDVMPEPVALSIAPVALAGPSGELARSALAGSERASLRSLLETQAPETTP